MASDFEMNDASDQGRDDDVDSLASTAESELEAEYVVNAIHAERKSYVELDSEDDEGALITQYLVEWAGYSIDRCSWEPKESFTSDETLRDWEKKKKQIAAGKTERFSVKSWEKHVSSVQKETQRRKEERKRKREQRAQRKSNPQAKPTRLTNSNIVDVHGSEGSLVAPKAPRPPSVDSTASSVLFVPAETPPPSIKPAFRQSLQQMTSSRPINSVAQESPNKTPSSRLARPVKNPIIKQKPPVRQKSPAQTARPALSSFGTGPGVKRAYRDRKERKWGEREPDMSQVQLMKPSDFSARTNMCTMGSAVGPSAMIPDPSEAQNQPLINNSIISTVLPNPPAGTTNARSSQPSEDNPAASPIMPPPALRSLKSTSTASASSLAASVGPSAQINPERPLGPVDFSHSPSALVDRPKAGAELPSINPAGPSDPVSNPSPPVAQSRPISQAKLSGPSEYVVSDGSNLSRAIPTGPRAMSTSAKPAGSSGSNLTPLLLATTIIPHAPGNSNSLARLRESQDSREIERRHDTHRPSGSSPRRPSKLSFQPPLSRESSPSRQLLREIDNYGPPHSPSPDYYRPPQRYPSPVGGDSDSLANDQASAITEARPGASVPPGLSIQAQISRMPSRRPGIGCMKAGPYWWNHSLGEALIHVFIGLDKRPLGPFRLCGISPHVKRLLVRAKNFKTNQAEVWFKHLCTVREYERLCDSSVSILSCHHLLYTADAG